MRLWNNIRNYFYGKNIAEKLPDPNTKRAITNLNDAKTVGIIYDSTNPDNDTVIRKFVEVLRKQGKTVDILGFVNDKTTEHKSGILVFNKKGVSWTLIPTDKKVDFFSKSDFDLLLACFTEENFPLEYVARISKAKWKVGHYSGNKTDFYDLMINVNGRNDLSYFLEQATHFLNQLKYDSK